MVMFKQMSDHKYLMCQEHKNIRLDDVELKTIPNGDEYLD